MFVVMSRFKKIKRWLKEEFLQSETIFFQDEQNIYFLRVIRTKNIDKCK